MADPTAFAKMVPGFDFLQGLVKNAGAALPGIGQWVAPTLNPEEIEKRINELKTVQFWLEHNAKMIGTTVQALEVQRMTLSTLQSMNVQMGDLKESLKLPVSPTDHPFMGAFAAAATPPMAGMASAKAAPEASNARPNPFRAAKPAADVPERKPKGAATKRGKAGAAAFEPLVDPMQWWGALTKQFTQIATQAVKDSAGDAARQLAGAMARQGMEAAGETLKRASAVPGDMAEAAKAATQAATRVAASAVQVAKTAGAVGAGAAAKTVRQATAAPKGPAGTTRRTARKTTTKPRAMP